MCYLIGLFSLRARLRARARVCVCVCVCVCVKMCVRVYAEEEAEEIKQFLAVAVTAHTTAAAAPTTAVASSPLFHFALFFSYDLVSCWTAGVELLFAMPLLWVAPGKFGFLCRRKRPEPRRSALRFVVVMVDEDDGERDDDDNDDTVLLVKLVSKP